MEVEIKRLLEESPADPRRHLDQDRVRRYAEVLDQLPPVTVFELEDHTLLLTDGYHRLPPRSRLAASSYKLRYASEPKRRRSSSPSMSHGPSGACRLTRRERLFGATAAVRATMPARTFDPTAPRSFILRKPSQSSFRCGTGGRPADPSAAGSSRVGITSFGGVLAASAGGGAGFWFPRRQGR
jgi:hypothetical protein